MNARFAGVAALAISIPKSTSWEKKFNSLWTFPRCNQVTTRKFYSSGAPPPHQVRLTLMKSAAFVGAGPTAIYTLHALLERADVPFALTIFEEQAEAGRGTPYRPGWNDPAMLSNIASVEIPPLEESLVAWARVQPREKLARRGLDPEDITERTFFPRLALGDFFQEQFKAMISRAQSLGISVEVRTRSRVTDAKSMPDGMILSIQPRGGDPYDQRFDHVVLATGHQWPAHPQVRLGYFVSPWPASELAKIPASHVGIRGTSLTAIDAVIALAVSHGAFTDSDDCDVGYMPSPGTQAFHLTMMSRKGLLPEADFYGPIPYAPLAICTADAVENLIQHTGKGLLDKAFALFKQELAHADPEYAEKLDLAKTSLEEFHDRYFEARTAADPFVWAERNLAEAQRNYAAKRTVQWRYAILRMHGVIELLVPYLEQDDYERFSKFFKPVFVDDYATVPHKSIKRMLALHRAGKLDVLAIGDDYRIDTHGHASGAEIIHEHQRLSFPYFIEAMGQKPLGAKSFPFPSLIRQGIVQDAAAENGNVSRGIAIDDVFHPLSDKLPTDQLFCLSLPFILGRHPFHQGITSSHEMGITVAEQLAAALGCVSSVRAGTEIVAQ
ncbi:MAG: FAD/NAD(P)-binding protein [Rhizomicrobium sp.]